MNKNKLLFLDIDGVINPLVVGNFEKERTNRETAREQFIRILYETNCSVVVSSSWRTLPEFSDGISMATGIESFFKINDFVSHWIGNTPDLNKDRFPSYVDYTDRGEEIKKWIEDNNYTGKFAIVDDILCEFKGLESHLFNTDLETGITKDIADKIINFLNSNENVAV